MQLRSRKHTASILLSTDFQQPAWRAFSYGLNLARGLGARLKILHVIKTARDSSGLSPDSRYLNSLRTSALLQLGRLARLAKEAGVDAEPRLQFGVPDVCILESARHDKPKMIVIGTEGRTGWDRLKVGSTAQAVIRGASCPVFTVHARVAGDAFHHPARITLSRILVATDFSGYSDAILHDVTGLALNLQTRILIVHVADNGIEEKKGQRRMERAIEQASQYGIEADGLCVPGVPVDAILNQAARWHADVIAVGTRGRRRPSHLLIGSVAEGILRRAGCPVLVLQHSSPRGRDESRRSCNR